MEKITKPYRLKPFVGIAAITGLILLLVFWPLMGIIVLFGSMIGMFVLRVYRPSQVRFISFKINILELAAILVYALAFPLASYLGNNTVSGIALIAAYPFLTLAYVFGAYGLYLYKTSLGYLPGFAVAVFLQAYFLYVLYRAIRYRNVPNKPLEQTR